MATDSPCNKLPNSGNDSSLFDEDFFQSFERSQLLEPGEIAPCSNMNWEMDFLRDREEPDPVLQYINQMLLEENVEGEAGMFQDPLALQTTEKSFYDVLGKNSSTPSPHEPLICNKQNAEVQDCSSESSSKLSAAISAAGSMSSDLPCIFVPENYESSLGRDNVARCTTHPSSHTCSARQSHSFSGAHDSFTSGQMDAFAKTKTIQSIFSDIFKRGIDEGSKFLPAVSQLIGDSAIYTLPAKTDLVTSELVVDLEKNETPEFHSDFRRRKHCHCDDDELNYRRSSKQYATAVSMLEDELSDKFDRVLLNHVPPEDLTIDNASHQMQSAPENRLLSGGKTRAGKTGIGCDVPDLCALLMSCAQSLASDNRKTANEQLKMIKKNASPIGDPAQRLAILFANALEARLAGTGPEQYLALTSKRISATEQLKFYRLFHITPFKAIPVIFGNQMILERASKATTLHIIDFGIGYGFQWPSLIQHLSQRPGGPPMLRITGIEIPQPGFRPAEGVEETGHRLARYCKRFYVPFEYHAIAARNWETMRVEELKVTRGEVLVVNCQLRFKSLLDETVDENSPKDAVLNLIRNLNPDIFLNVHVNGLHGSPFFLTRFRDAFLFFFAIFDAADNILPRNDEQRLKFEHNLLGPQIMNLVACEGRNRVERPESYKQWQIRCIRAGFKLLPLRQDLLKELRNRVKKDYHKDFVFDEDGYSILQGWKGKIITASSCWVPA